MSKSSSTEIIIDGRGDQAIRQAVQVLRGGGLIGFPTETVYGLAANVENENAIRRIFVVKNRPTNHPLIVHIADATELDDWAIDIPPAAYELASHLWPGPLTMLLRRNKRISTVATGGRDTVAIRIPDHNVALRLLHEFNGALAAPSANRFGKVSPTTAQHVLADLGSDVDLIVDGGPCAVGIESTIIDMTTTTPQILRPGGIAIERIESILNTHIEYSNENPRAPGMLESHYAPRCLIELVESSDAAIRRAQVLRHTSRKVEVLDYSHDVDVFAAKLYEFLRAADRHGCDVVVAVLPSAVGLGQAIRDRLYKASTTRPNPYTN